MTTQTPAEMLAALKAKKEVTEQTGQEIPATDPELSKEALVELGIKDDGPVNTAAVQAAVALQNQEVVADPAELEEKRKSRVLNRFCSHMPSCKVILPNGLILEFREGTYHTDDSKEIKFLQKECRTNPHLYIDPARTTVVEAELDPDYEVEQRMRAKIMREIGDSLSDEQRKILAGSSRDVKVVSAGSTSTV